MHTTTLTSYQRSLQVLSFSVNTLPELHKGQDVFAKTSPFLLGNRYLRQRGEVVQASVVDSLSQGVLQYGPLQGIALKQGQASVQQPE
jgi:hypothetical protein